MAPLCQEITGNKVPIESISETSYVDIPLYISDYQKTQNTFDWKPKILTKELFKDIYQWIVENENSLKSLF